MRVVVQRVNNASVKIAGNTIGKINKGLFCLLYTSDAADD